MSLRSIAKATAPAAVARAETSSQSGEKHIRKPSVRNVSSACNACRKRRCRCNGESPCMTCAQAGEECIYDHKDGRRRSRLHGSSLGNLLQHQQVLHALIEAIQDGREGSIIAQIRQGASVDQLAIALEQQIEHSESDDSSPSLQTEHSGSQHQSAMTDDTSLSVSDSRANGPRSPHFDGRYFRQDGESKPATLHARRGATRDACEISARKAFPSTAAILNIRRAPPVLPPPVTTLPPHLSHGTADSRGPGKGPNLSHYNSAVAYLADTNNRTSS